MVKALSKEEMGSCLPINSQTTTLVEKLSLSSLHKIIWKMTFKKFYWFFFHWFFLSFQTLADFWLCFQRWKKKWCRLWDKWWWDIGGYYRALIPRSTKVVTSAGNFQKRSRHHSLAWKIPATLESAHIVGTRQSSLSKVRRKIAENK